MSSGTACPGQADLTQATLTARIELLARRDQAQEERICALEVTVRQIADELWRLKTSSAPDAGGAAVLYEADDSGFQGLAPSKENKAPSRHITPSGKRAALGMSPLGRKSPYIPDVQPSPGGMRKPAQRCLAFAEAAAHHAQPAASLQANDRQADRPGSSPQQEQQQPPQQQLCRPASRNLQGHLLPGRPFASLFPAQPAGMRTHPHAQQDHAAPMDSDCLDDAFACLVDGPPIDADFLGELEGEGSSPQPPGNPLQPSERVPCWISPRHPPGTACSSPG